jgi:hypothetical protein
MENLSNNAITTIAANVGLSDTTISVASSTGFPSPNFRIVIDSEIMLVTAVSGTAWTVTRGQESSSVAGHTAGASVANVLTVAGLLAAVDTDGSSITLAGDVTGTAGANVVSTVGGSTASAVHAAAVAVAAAGSDNGLATLNGSGQLTSSQIPAALVGALVYQGLWNATTNSSPTLVSSTGTKGFYYVVSVAGTTTLDGLNSWSVGDTAIFDGATWNKIDGIASEVVSVAGRTGAVVLSHSDISGLANSATIAAATADTPSTIVERDSSGNFSAGTIAASGLAVNGSSALTGAVAIQLNTSTGNPAALTISNNYSNQGLNIVANENSAASFQGATALGSAGPTVLISDINQNVLSSTGITIDGSGNITATSITGNGSGLTSLNAGSISSGSVPLSYGGTGVSSGLSVLSGSSIHSGTVSAAYLPTATTSALGVVETPAAGALTNSSGSIGVNVDNSTIVINGSNKLAVNQISGNSITSGSVSASYLPPAGTSGLGIVNVPAAGGLAVSGGAVSANVDNSTIKIVSNQLVGQYTGTVTNIAASVPSVLSISGSPITTSGTLAIGYSGTALPVANGGTGTTTALTSGSVVYAGASGVYSQDNTNFNYNSTHKALSATHLSGVNSTAPTIAAGAALGTGGSVGATITGANATGTASDTAGQIVLVSGSSGTTTGTLATITFGTAFATAPIVIVTPANLLGACCSAGFSGSQGTPPFPYVSATTTGGWTFTMGEFDFYANSTYAFNYLVIGTNG